MVSEYQKLRQERLAARKMTETEKRQRYTLSRELMKERQAERNRREMEARRRANLVLQSRHAEEYKSLLADEKAALDEERGPLPGDDQ